MKTQITHDRYQRRLSQDYNEQELTFKDLCDIVRSPTISETKNNASCIYPFCLNYKNGATTAVQDNAHSLTILVMDVDNGYSIDQFIETFSEYQFVLYSTYSNTLEKNRFKAFFPLDHPLELKILRSKWFKKWFQKKYPFNDESILKFVGIYLPNCPTLDTYRYHINEGRLYDFNDYDEEIIKEKERWIKLDKLKEASRKRKDEQYIHRDSVSVLNNSKVQDFLSGKYRSSGGGLPFFTALAVCRKANDTKTRDLVIEEAYVGNWNDNEIQHKLRSSGW